MAEQQRFQYHFEYVAGDPLRGATMSGPHPVGALTDVTNRFAREGWRLVAVTPFFRSSDGFILSFERPLEG